MLRAKSYREKYPAAIGRRVSYRDRKAVRKFSQLLPVKNQPTSQDKGAEFLQQQIEQLQAYFSTLSRAVAIFQDMAYSLPKRGIETAPSHGGTHQAGHCRRQRYPGAVLYDGMFEIINRTVVEEDGCYPVGHVVGGNGKLINEQAFECTPDNSRNRHTLLEERKEGFQLVMLQMQRHGFRIHGCLQKATTPGPSLSRRGA